jgi:hydroxyacylglutathione hydrolase
MFVHQESHNSLHVITLPTGPLQTNSTFVFDDTTKDLLIFDAGHQSELSESIIEKYGLTPKAILHTHTHFDHMAAAGPLKRKYKCRIEIPAEDQFLYDVMNESAARFGLQFEPTEPVDQHLKLDQTIGLGEHKELFKIISTPGHTPGGVCFYSESFNQPLLIAGDTLFQGSIGRTDLPGGNHQQLLDSIRNNLFCLPEDTIVITGHGPTTTIGREKTTNPFF